MHQNCLKRPNFCTNLLSRVILFFIWIFSSPLFKLASSFRWFCQLKKPHCLTWRRVRRSEHFFWTPRRFWFFSSKLSCTSEHVLVIQTHTMLEHHLTHLCLTIFCILTQSMSFYPIRRRIIWTCSKVSIANHFFLTHFIINWILRVLLKIE